MKIRASELEHTSLTIKKLVEIKSESETTSKAMVDRKIFLISLQNSYISLGSPPARFVNFPSKLVSIPYFECDQFLGLKFYIFRKLRYILFSIICHSTNL